MKHLYIILLILPLIGFGQGLNFQLGSTCIVPFKTNNFIGNDFISIEQVNEYGLVNETTSQIGVQGSLTYDFNFQEISDKFFLSPTLTYTLINLNIYEKTGPIINDFNQNHHLIQLSFNSSYQVHEKFTPSFGIPLDSQLFSRLKGESVYDFIVPEGVDEVLLPNETVTVKGKDNEFIFLGFSGKFSIEFQINNQFSIYSNFSFPLKTFKDEGSYLGDGGKDQSSKVRSIGYTVPRKHISLGLGFSL